MDKKTSINRSRPPPYGRQIKRLSARADQSRHLTIHPKQGENPLALSIIAHWGASCYIKKDIQVMKHVLDRRTKEVCPNSTRLEKQIYMQR